MEAEQLLFYIIIAVFMSTVTGAHMCPDVFELHDVCSSPGKKTAFHCLIYSGTDVYWEYERDAYTDRIRIAQNEKVVETLTYKYEADIFSVNRTHSCAQLAINVDEDDPDKAYYMCAFVEKELPAQLRISNFKSDDLKAFISLIEVEGEFPNSTVTDIVAAVTDFWGIPGLKLKLYVDDLMVKMVPGGSLKCEESTHVNLTYSLQVEPGRDLKIKLNYTHRALQEEKTLHELLFLNKRRQPMIQIISQCIAEYRNLAAGFITMIFVSLLLAVGLIVAVFQLYSYRHIQSTHPGRVGNTHAEQQSLRANGDGDKNARRGGDVPECCPGGLFLLDPPDSQPKYPETDYKDLLHEPEYPGTDENPDAPSSQEESNNEHADHPDSVGELRRRHNGSPGATTAFPSESVIHDNNINIYY